MIIALPNTQKELVAVQAVAHIQRVDRTLSRSVLEGMLRELIEHWIVRVWLETEHSTEAVEAGLRSDLQGRGVVLKALQLRPLPQRSSEPPADCLSDWTEILLDDLSTKDGFQVTLDLVVRTWVSRKVDEIDGMLAPWKAMLRINLERELRQAFKDRDLEDLLRTRGEWAAKVLDILGNGEVDESLDQMHQEVLGPGHHAALDSLWVTDVQIKARQEAFRPWNNARYADPFTHFFFLAYGDVIREPLREDSDR